MPVIIPTVVNRIISDMNDLEKPYTKTTKDIISVNYTNSIKDMVSQLTIVGTYVGTIGASPSPTTKPLIPFTASCNNLVISTPPNTQDAFSSWYDTLLNDIVSNTELIPSDPLITLNDPAPVILFTKFTAGITGNTFNDILTACIKSNDFSKLADNCHFFIIEDIYKNMIAYFNPIYSSSYSGGKGVLTINSIT